MGFGTSGIAPLTTQRAETYLVSLATWSNLVRYEVLLLVVELVVNKSRDGLVSLVNFHLQYCM